MIYHFNWGLGVLMTLKCVRWVFYYLRDRHYRGGNEALSNLDLFEKTGGIVEGKYENTHKKKRVVGLMWSLRYEMLSSSVCSILNI